MKKIVLAILAILVVAGVAGAAITLTSKQSSKQIYRQALEQAINTENAYLSFTVAADDIAMEGEVGGSIAEEDYDLKASIKANSEINGVPLELAFDMVGREDDNTEKSFLRYASVETTDSEFTQSVDDYFAPAIGKWVSIENPEEADDDAPSNFKTEGPFAAFDLVGIFTPIVALSETDRQEFLRLVDKYNLYNVNETVEEVTFKGIAMRKLKVSVNKDTLVEFEKEADQALSDEADFAKTDDQLIEQAFGDGDSLEAEVYVATDKAEFTGLDLDITLDKSVTEESFNTAIKQVDTTILIEQGREFSVDLPTEFITEEQLQALLAGE